MIDAYKKDGKLYTTCKCGRVYNISALYDMNKPFICPVCEFERRKRRGGKAIKLNKHGIRIEDEC